MHMCSSAHACAYGSHSSRGARRIQAIGGGDTCEDVFTGLEAAEKLSWKSHNRIVFHVADAPCHGTEFHGPSYSDHWPKGDKKERDIKDILKRLQKQATTNYFFSHLNNSTETMIRKFMEVTKPGWLKVQDSLHLSNVSYDLQHVSCELSMFCRSKDP